MPAAVSLVRYEIEFNVVQKTLNTISYYTLTSKRQFLLPLWLNSKFGFNYFRFSSLIYLADFPYLYIKFKLLFCSAFYFKSTVKRYLKASDELLQANFPSSPLLQIELKKHMEDKGNSYVYSRVANTVGQLERLFYVSVQPF